MTRNQHSQEVCDTIFLSACPPLQIPVPESFTPRSEHASGLVHISQTRRALVMVGGVSDYSNKYSSALDWTLISQTTVLEFGKFTGCFPGTCTYIPCQVVVPYGGIF